MEKGRPKSVYVKTSFPDPVRYFFSTSEILDTLLLQTNTFLIHPLNLSIFYILFKSIPEGTEALKKKKMFHR